MKHPGTQFKSLAVALKELEPFVRKGEHLQTGRPFDKFGGMRSREILANWLVCVATNAATEGELTFCSDPTGGDGIHLRRQNRRDLADRACHGAEASPRRSRRRRDADP
jgi:hypothetical protein